MDECGLNIHPFPKTEEVKQQKTLLATLWLAVLTSMYILEENTEMSENPGDIVFSLEFKFQTKVRVEQTHFRHKSECSLPMCPFLRSYWSTFSSNFLKYLFIRSKPGKVNQVHEGVNQTRKRNK
jgi:hypothetical protein